MSLLTHQPLIEETTTPKNLIKRLFIYCLGLFIMAIGVSFSVKSDLGVSPVNSIAYVVSEVLKMKMGTWTTITFCCYLVIQFLILRRRFNPFRLTQILCSFLFGWYVDITNFLADLLLPAPEVFPLVTALGLDGAPEFVAVYAVRLVYLVISMACVGLGIFLYVAPKQLPPLPGEGLMLVISQEFRIPLYKVKIGFDCTIAGTALLISLLYFHAFHGVREGTVLAAIGVGEFLGIFQRLFTVQLYRFIELNPPELKPKKFGTSGKKPEEEAAEAMAAEGHPSDEP